MLDEIVDNALEYNCQWDFALCFDPAKKGCVGYLMAFEGCESISLRQDMTLWNPFDGSGQTRLRGERFACCGVLDRFHYTGGPLDPITLSGYVSKAAAQDIRNTVSQPLSSLKTKLAWYIVDFDEDSRHWYEAAYCKVPGKVMGNLNTTGGNVQFGVSREPVRISQQLDIRVYKFYLQVVPQVGKKTQLFFATGPQGKMIKQWGE